MRCDDGIKRPVAKDLERVNCETFEGIVPLLFQTHYQNVKELAG